MEVEIGRAVELETPASCMGKAFLHPITDMMVFNGIEAISSDRYSCGFGSHLHVTIAPFASAPKPIRDQGVLVKDALAKLLSVANITRVVIKMTDSELDELNKSWENAVRDANTANGESVNGITSGSEGTETNEAVHS